MLILRSLSLSLGFSMVLMPFAPAAPAWDAPSEPSPVGWSRLADMNSPHEYHAAVVAEGKIYVVGGGEAAQCEEYDPATNRWNLLPQMPTAGRCFPGAAAIGRKIYVIGGTSRSVNVYATVEAYDIIRRSWTKCADLLVPRNRLAAVALGGKIYALGGMDAKGNSSAVEEYDPTLDRWIKRKDMPSPRHGHSAVVFDNKILVLGGEGEGFGKLTTVEEYDPKTDRWNKRSPMPTQRAFLGVAAVGGYVYAVGGRVRGAPPVERYDPKTNQWTRLAPMPGSLRNRFGIATIADKIYVLGGERQDDRRMPFSVWRYDPPAP